MCTSTSMFPDPVLYQRYGPIPSHSCNVEAFPIPYLGALERIAHVVGGWSSDTARAYAISHARGLARPLRTQLSHSLGDGVSHTEVTATRTLLTGATGVRRGRRGGRRAATPTDRPRVFIKLYILKFPGVGVATG